MAVFVDARIPVVFVGEAGPLDAVLAPADSIAHAAGCACCVARSPVAAGLDRLFLQRVRGEMPWFTRVVALEDTAALRTVIETDAVISARFRLG